ncbi:XRE family transcriptional regulator [Nocardia panacis]|uniref:XRE family transcriptional regulator n=1 Tax=Nocardia panacis TaxID=2340916 RepID=A0A3A4KR07_9NOCA|nr:XRE family transcriptional regulator [Nocardia panacis]
MTGPLLRELRVVAGIGLRKMAARTHFSPSYLSQIENEKRPVPIDVVRAYREVLGNDPVLDVDRLAAAISEPASVGSSATEDLAVILERTRHLEDQVGAVLVTPAIRGIDTVARALVPAGGAAMASEVACYRGWLEHVGGHYTLADKALTDAAKLGEASGDGSLFEHALSFLAYTAWHRGDLARALDVTDAAIHVPGAHPVLPAYDRYQQAELLAAEGDAHRAVRALHKADRAAELTDGLEPPRHGYWYVEGFWGVQRGVVLALLGRQAEAVREASAGVAVLPAEFQRAEWLEIMLHRIDPEWS